MIYYVEDDSSIRELVLYTLKTTGFEAKGFESGEGLFAELSRGNNPELLLLDIMLPGEDGMEIIKRLKRGGYDFPVIMVTAKNSEYDKVTGLDCGADDYIAKPFGMMELVARIKAVLRRSERSGNISSGDVLSCGSVELDARSHIVTVNGVPAELTLKEFELLRILMKNKNAVLTRDTLLESIWGYDCAGETRTVDVHVKTLRQKLGEGAEIIKTVRGVGYKVSG
ncbi:MAG: response regulator transcription factor [Oscillospiraceae bacterium]|nr:response regulator transcription factor [Oscillospiraceae bacterium]